jgi:hypothetical protein
MLQDALLYQTTAVDPYNLNIPVTPAAVTYPQSAEELMRAAEVLLSLKPYRSCQSYVLHCAPAPCNHSQSLVSAVGPAHVTFQDALLYQTTAVDPYNLNIPVTPASTS